MKPLIAFFCSITISGIVSSKQLNIEDCRKSATENATAIALTGNKVLSLPMTCEKIELNGIAEEKSWSWTETQFQILDKHKGEDVNLNNEARFKMLNYGYSIIYIYVEVRDSKLDTSQSKNVWEKDCVEVFFSLDTANRRTAESGKSGFLQLRKIYGREMTDFKEKGYQAFENSFSGGFAQEWKVPLDSVASTLVDKSKWDHRNFRFDIQNGDNDGSGRNSQLFWNSNADDQWNCIRNQGYVMLNVYCTSVYDVCSGTSISSTADETEKIKIESDYIIFNYPADYKLYSITGAVISEGIKVNRINIAGLKKGLYIIQTQNQNLKIIR